jgi:hypothetical protein
VCTRDAADYLSLGFRLWLHSQTKRCT